MWTDFNSFTFGFADKLRNKVKIKSSTAPEFCCRTTLWKLPSMRGSKNGGDKGDQASHDFLGRQNCSPPRAPITHATPLLTMRYMYTYGAVVNACTVFSFVLHNFYSAQSSSNWQYYSVMQIHVIHWLHWIMSEPCQVNIANKCFEQRLPLI